MRIGCSECLCCVAIESHRPALVESLLQRSDVVYRDIYWAPAPSCSSKAINWIGTDYPLLHDVGPDMVLSLVGRDDCGHMRVDAELRGASLDFLHYERAYILVSLQMMARWHTSEHFNFEHILRRALAFGL